MKDKLMYLYIGAVAVVAVAGTLILGSGSWTVTCVACTIVCILPFFIRFERENNTFKNVTLAVLAALSCVGRMAFAPFPGFKPVAAVTIICGMYMGPVYGFMCGSLSAVLSNLYFGQGPWTAFQMLAWGLCGFFAGLWRRPLKKNRWLLMIYGAVCGVMFSLILDIWTSVWMDDAFNAARFFSYVAVSLPMMAEYSVSNCIFLWFLAGPVGRRLDRIFLKYGIEKDSSYV